LVDWLYDRTMTGLAAVVFDFDGIILDSETPEYEAHRLIYERAGLTLTPGEWCDQIGIWSEGYEDRWFTTLCERAAAPPFADREAFQAEKSRLFQQLVSPEPMRGIRELLGALEAASIPAAVASSSPSRWVVPALERLGLASRFGAIVTGSDVARRKPAPDGYLEATRRLGADPRRSIAVEDSAPGIAAARAAGMKAIAIPHWLTSAHDLSAADLRVEHAGELTVAALEALCEAYAARPGQDASAGRSGASS
jgi:HAD superfamily hydrolase (TIGR01509 family)